eukprot:scaffold12434_cov109-Skeletonema_dohrnii-CCMP3373.AAC.1
MTSATTAISHHNPAVHTATSPTPCSIRPMDVCGWPDITVSHRTSINICRLKPSQSTTSQRPSFIMPPPLYGQWVNVIPQNFVGRPNSEGGNGYVEKTTPTDRL